VKGPIRGVIEGFYGRPWTWHERAEVMAACHGWGMTHYVYAPKDDAKHRRDWRQPYGAEELTGFTRLVEAGTLRVAFAIAPGLSIAYDDPDDRAALAAKVDPLVARGVDLVCLALDDIPPGAHLGTPHAALTTWLRDHLDGRARVLLVPTEYTGTRPSPYLDALAAGVPDDVPIAWTGPTVVADEITVAQARARADAVGGRAPLLWDNYPVNDGTMGDRLFMGPLRGREPGLEDVCVGWLANPMVQPRASLLPLASVAARLRGDDPEAAWRVEADRSGLRTFAEACDGTHPLALVSAAVGPDAGAGALDELAGWLDAAAACAAPGLEEEGAPWLEQVHDEAEAGRAAVGLLRLLGQEPLDRHRVAEAALLVGYLWARARRGSVSAMGVRLGVRPVLSQGADGGWRYHRGAVTEDSNAIDRLCRDALDRIVAAGAAADAEGT
jgi:hyaluronoglucosaminidase